MRTVLWLSVAGFTALFACCWRAAARNCGCKRCRNGENAPVLTDQHEVHAMWLTLVLLTGSVLAADLPTDDGIIEGVVVRAADQSPVAGAEVVLRAGVDGQLLPVAETTADDQGRFRFEHLRTDGAYRLSAGGQSRRHPLSRPQRAADFAASVRRK